MKNIFFVLSFLTTTLLLAQNRDATTIHQSHFELANLVLKARITLLNQEKVPLEAPLKNHATFSCSSVACLKDKLANEKGKHYYAAIVKIHEREQAASQAATTDVSTYLMDTYKAIVEIQNNVKGLILVEESVAQNIANQYKPIEKRLADLNSSLDGVINSQKTVHLIQAEREVERKIATELTKLDSTLQNLKDRVKNADNHSTCDSLQQQIPSLNTEYRKLYEKMQKMPTKNHPIFYTVLGILILGAFVWVSKKYIPYSNDSKNANNRSNESSEPLNGVSEPLNGASEPLNGASEPLNGASEPLNGASEPLNGASEPLNGASEPTIIPVEPTIIPVEPTIIPAEPTIIPAEPTIIPVEPTIIPVEPTIQPVEPTTQQVEPTIQPIKPTIQWYILKASVRGEDHIKYDLPCQDAHYWEDLGAGWQLTVVCDGAGSAKHSDEGATFIAQRVIPTIFKKILEKRDWQAKNRLPIEDDWRVIAKDGLDQAKSALKIYANRKSCELKDLACTVIIVIQTPKGILMAHIGDGRAAYYTEEKGWQAMMQPFRGAEVNQTVFLTNKWEQASHLYFESRVIEAPITAYTLMSDGCERTAFECHRKEEGVPKAIDPNEPNAKYLDKVRKYLHESIQRGKLLKDLNHEWIAALNEGFTETGDDKTMIFALKI